VEAQAGFISFQNGTGGMNLYVVETYALTRLNAIT
jgi:hypothetical protein